MKRLIGAVMAVALLVSVAPVVAGDSFQALSRLPAGLTPLDDAQLAAVEGGQVDVCIVCENESKIYQSNWASNFSGLNVQVGKENEFEQEIEQTNVAVVNQEIN
jgi:hypothetical protein